MTAMAGLLLMEGQKAWEHDEGHASGYFHTYDALNIDPAYPYARKVHVFLPRSYTGGGQRYPVVYMNDGHTAFFPGGFHGATWDMAAVLANLYAQHMREVIVVAVHPVMRDREYTHAWWHGDECCMLSVYARYLARGLKPFLDRNYRTLPGAADSMILGASHGGLAAFYTAVRHPDTFGFAAALSPSFWAGTDDAAQFPRVIPTRVSLKESALLDDLGPYLTEAARGGTKPRLFLDWGLKRHL